MYKCKLLDFKTSDCKIIEDDIHCHQFQIQLFGIDSSRTTYSITVNDFQPYFYVKVPFFWKINDKNSFINFLHSKLFNQNNTSPSNSLDDDISAQKLFCSSSVLVKQKKLYGFDADKNHKFIKLYFKSLRAFNKVKNLWYRERILIPNGIKYKNKSIELYEAQIPPLLRFFHEREISPSGWISISTDTSNSTNTTFCTTECNTSYKNIHPIHIDTPVPYKICSFDIEASSSHGDFPLPIKTYKKLSNEIVDLTSSITINETYLTSILYKAFSFEANDINVSKVFPKKNIDITSLDALADKILQFTTSNFNQEKAKLSQNILIEDLFHNNSIDSDNENDHHTASKLNNSSNKNIIQILTSDNISRDEKIQLVNIILTRFLPELQGDKVTFIGSTFINYGDTVPYKNHCLVLNTCDKIHDVNHSIIQSCTSETELLLEWTKLIHNEDPDIIIGYNIFGFDYDFMFRRAIQNNCTYKFLQLSRNKNELCGHFDKDGTPHIQETSIILASGPHNLNYINMSGRLQIDLYNFFRRDYNLPSYKLDSVSGHFIGDNINSFIISNNKTQIYSNNLSGLTISSFIHIEEINHTNEYLNNGEKYKVIEINKESSSFTLENIVENLNSKKTRWCLAKDDVTPQDIFKLTNGTSSDRAIVAKYCIQDCNLVHSLMKKIDILTGFIEMSKLCSVPINFLVLRGQGIKLTSFISKKCREKNTLMPVLKGYLDNDEGYEGAIVLEPKCDIYLDNPVACVDYSSLYPSSMISENLCHSSKVWTKEYNLDNELINQTGICDCTNNFIYDNLPDYTYVDIEYDTYTYVRKSSKSAVQKVKSGTKICRFAESKHSKAILPSVLQELLFSRKATKKQMAKESDPFMKNILDKRQLSIKLTANSLYGQCGAKTSAFYEKDVAACTTATGRKLLIYAKNIIEGVYGDTICDTKSFGKVQTNAEYIYGDTDSVFFTFNLKNINTCEKIVGKDALAITIELAQVAGELASKFLKPPHDLEYEKTFLPFCLLSKKRYVGMLHEFDINKSKCKSMGIVLKRRDNAPIVKDIYGGIIDIIMNDKNIHKSLSFLQTSLESIFQQNYHFDKFIVTKSLRSGYKNPNQIAHKVLADRMGQRDPGNKPAPGDRIPYAYVITSKPSKLQGDKIEHPSFIIENNLPIDYTHYITNQIMKPVLQIYSLVLFQLPIFKSKLFLKNRITMELQDCARKLSGDAIHKKQEQIKNKYAQQLIFDPIIKKFKEQTNTAKSITSFFN